MNLPLYTHYAGQLLVLLAAVFACLCLVYAILWLAWRIYRSFQGWPLILAALQHFYAANPERFKSLKLLASVATAAKDAAQATTPPAKTPAEPIGSVPFFKPQGPQ